MLTQHPMLQGKMPAAFTEPAFQCHEDEGFRRLDVNETRFKFVCDELNPDKPLAAVTDRYALVQNRDIVAAVDVLASNELLDLEPVSARYRNGRSEYKFRIPGMEYRAPNDRSHTQATITVGNDYKGSAGISVLSGWFRLVCTNGMVIGTTAHRSITRHVGEIDLREILAPAIAGLRDRFEVDRLLADTLGRSRVRLDAVPSVELAREHAAEGTSMPLVGRIMADTAPRYERHMLAAVERNREDIGDTAWALAQAVAEVSTHHMRGFAAGEWATRQLNRIREHVGA